MREWSTERVFQPFSRLACPPLKTAMYATRVMIWITAAM